MSNADRLERLAAELEEIDAAGETAEVISLLREAAGEIRILRQDVDAWRFPDHTEVIHA